LKHIEIFVNEDKQEKTSDISKVIPEELIDSLENTVLDSEIQEHGINYQLVDFIIDPFDRRTNKIQLPPIKAIVDQNCYILNTLQIMFNTILKVEDSYIKNECTQTSLAAAVNNYITRGLTSSLWGKNGYFRNLCVAHRNIDSVRGVALPNANYGIHEVGIPRRAMSISDRKHGDYCLVTRYPAIWDGSIEVVRARASNNDCIEIHPLLHKQLNLDHDGDDLTIFWVPKEKECLEEAENNLLQFFKAEGAGTWPKQLIVNNESNNNFETDDLDLLKKETKERFIPNGLSIDPIEIISGNHNLDQLFDKNYKEDTLEIANGIDSKNFYKRTTNINLINLTMKMFMGPVGSISNDVKLIGKNGNSKVRRSAMHISEKIQQALMDSKHEIGSPNNMKFMKMKNAIGGTGETGKDIGKILDCLNENGIELDKSLPFIVYMYLIIPFKATIYDLIQLPYSDKSSLKDLMNKISIYENRVEFSRENYKEIAISMMNFVIKTLGCSKIQFNTSFNENRSNVRNYIENNFPIYTLATKSQANNNVNKKNELCARVLIDKEIDAYGSCSDEFKKLES
jgi:hypothetical protein